MFTQGNACLSFVWTSQPSSAKSDPAEAKPDSGLREGGPSPTGFKLTLIADSDLSRSARPTILCVLRDPILSNHPNFTRAVVCSFAGKSTSNLSVYVIRCRNHPDRYYTGMTDNVERGPGVHNSGGSNTPPLFGHRRLSPSRYSRIPKAQRRLKGIRDWLRTRLFETPFRMSIPIT